ncbi:MAG: hypothetical protein FH761_05475 [Firmicutes bacterium]|nr:hypothetical protein [Bacillota bacterium]
MKSINNSSNRLRKLLIQNKCLNIVTCNKCNGTGLSQQAIHTTVEGKTITDLENMSIKESYKFLNSYKDKLYDVSLLSETLVKLKYMDRCRPLPFNTL